MRPQKASYFFCLWRMSPRNWNILLDPKYAFTYNLGRFCSYLSFKIPRNPMRWALEMKKMGLGEVKDAQVHLATQPRVHLTATSAVFIPIHFRDHSGI